MNDMTDEQQEVVLKLRKRTINDVTPKMLEDVSLFYRFSKARNFNLAEAESMLRKHIDWRKEYQVDTILTDYKPPEVLVKYVSLNFVCYDHEGGVVSLNDCGRMDYNGLLKVVKKTELLKYIIFYIEHDMERILKQGKSIVNSLYSGVYDLEGLSYAKSANIKFLQFAFFFFKSFFDNYPEIMKRIRIINAPTFFPFLYATFKPILPDSISQKMRVYGTDGWKEDLLEFTDVENLPVYLGGHKTDPDGSPLCETIINFGKTVPEKYYVNQRRKKLCLEPGVQKLTVRPFSTEKITFKVKEANTYLEWEFETETKDINFTLHFREKILGTFKPVQLIHQQRIDTNNEPEKGCFRCEKVGYYTIVFDNSYSWLHSKEVFFRGGLRNQMSEDI